MIRRKSPFTDETVRNFVARFRPTELNVSQIVKALYENNGISESSPSERLGVREQVKDALDFYYGVYAVIKAKHEIASLHEGWRTAKAAKESSLVKELEIVLLIGVHFSDDDEVAMARFLWLFPEELALKLLEMRLHISQEKCPPDYPREVMERARLLYVNKPPRN